MKYLLDTCTFVYLLDKTLKENITTILSNADNDIYITNESVKEFVHLVQGERIGYSKYVKETRFDVYDLIENKLSINVIYTNKQHVKQMMRLPMVEKHNDPIDRIIISIAIYEGMCLISSDTQFDKYIDFGLDLIQFKRPAEYKSKYKRG